MASTYIKLPLTVPSGLSPVGAANTIAVSDGSGVTWTQQLVLGASGFLSVGTTPATTGAIRLANTGATGAIYIRNAADSGNVRLIAGTGSDIVEVGDTTATYAIINGGAMQLRVGVSQAVTTYVNGTAVVAMGSEFVSIGAGTLAAAGNLRLANTGTISVRNAANSADLNLAKGVGSNVLQFGDDGASDVSLRGGGEIQLRAGPGQAVRSLVAGSQVGQFLAAGLVLGSGSGSFGGGVGCLFLTNAGTNPSTNPTGGAILYAESGAPKWRGTGGAVTMPAPAGTGTINTQNMLSYLHRAALRTTDATANQVIGSITVPSDTTVYVRIVTKAYNVTDNTALVFRTERAYRNSAGTVTLLGSAFDEDTGNDAGFTGSADTAISGTSVQARGTGMAAKNIDWQSDFYVEEC